MATYQTPGIYIEEIPAGSKPIESVGTSIVGLVGTASKADAHLNEAYAVNSWSQFVREFADQDSKSTPLSHADFGFFQNGGSRCYVVNIARMALSSATENDDKVLLFLRKSTRLRSWLHRVLRIQPLTMLFLIIANECRTALPFSTRRKLSIILTS